MTRYRSVRVSNNSSIPLHRKGYHMRENITIGITRFEGMISLAACADVTRANQSKHKFSKDSNTKVVQSTTNQNYQTNFTVRWLRKAGKYEVSKTASDVSFKHRVPAKELWDRIDWPFKKRVPNEPILPLEKGKLSMRNNRKNGLKA